MTESARARWRARYTPFRSLAMGNGVFNAFIWFNDVFGFEPFGDDLSSSDFLSLDRQWDLNPELLGRQSFSSLIAWVMFGGSISWAFGAALIK